VAKPLSIDAGEPEKLLEAESSQKSADSEGSNSLGRRNTGRFMDVVPPSSVRRASPSVPPRVSRQGISVDPVSKPTVASNEMPKPSVIDSSSGKTDKTGDWPDPIDFHATKNSTSQPKESVDEDNEDADIDKISNDITDKLGQMSDESPDSPFISGTKVDKRPLGAFSTESSTPSVKSPIPETLATNPVGPAKPVSVVTPFPAELQSDILSIEASSNTTNPDAETTPAVEIKAVDATVADDKPIGPTSITQQYKEQPSSGDQNTSAIYHSEAYHKALLRTSKKKPSWMIVVWIVLLIIAGAGAGAAVYYFVLPGL
jgi:hypothetical protein